MQHSQITSTTYFLLTTTAFKKMKCMRMKLTRTGLMEEANWETNWILKPARKNIECCTAGLSASITGQETDDKATRSAP